MIGKVLNLMLNWLRAKSDLHDFELKKYNTLKRPCPKRTNGGVGICNALSCANYWYSPLSAGRTAIDVRHGTLLQS
jgi:hypothetical protein